MKFLAEIKNKTITFGNDIYARFHLGKLEGKKVTVEVKKIFNKRSIKQNALMWMWFTIIADHTGHTPEEIHVIVKGLYCPKKTIKVGKKVYTIPRGTSELSKGEMVEFMMHIEAMAADMGIVLPTPEEYGKGFDNTMLSTE